MSSGPDSGSARQTGVIQTRQSEYSYGRFRLRVTAGSNEGQEVTSDGSEFTIGTARGNQLVITDGTVSRHHCSITALPRGFYLRDLGSTNGTTMAGFRIDGAYLKTGIVIGVGRTTLKFEILGDTICEPLSEEDRCGRVLGQSMAMRRIFALLPRIARSDSTVLLEGETGTGKGLLAEAIHQESDRAARDFVTVDCGAVSRTLIESELFGHEKGAFTSADATRIGMFETAQGGTVFLDEIGELPLDVQPKLLRALDERVIRRVGGTKPIQLDARVIAATNRDLRKEVNNGTFRSDLYYRLNTVRISVPPLRSRTEDIPLLVKHFYQQFVDDEHASPPSDLVETFTRRSWPGNVRELRGAVEQAVLLGGARLPSVFPTGMNQETDDDEFNSSLSFRASKERSVSRWEHQYVAQLLERHGGNVSAAARGARMDRSHLRELLRKYGLLAQEG